MKQLIKVILSIFLALTFTNGSLILNSPVLTNYGTWGSWVDCTENTYVKSIDVKFLPDNFGGNKPPPGDDFPDLDDNKGLTDIALECVPFKIIGTPTSQIIATSNKDQFTLPLRTECDDFAIGFQLMSDSQQIALDNTGANNIRIYCSDLKSSSTEYIEAYGEYKGEWTDVQMCKPRQAICGIQSQEENSAPDATGINNVRLKCCDIQSPGISCTPTERWEIVQECDNINGTSPMQCKFLRKVGIGIGVHLEDTFSSKEYYRNEAIGFSVNGDAYWILGDLSSNFIQILSNSSVTGHDWSEINSETWNEETITEIQMEVKEGRKGVISQLVGSCSYFSVRTPSFKKEDFQKREH